MGQTTGFGTFAAIIGLAVFTWARMYRLLVSTASFVAFISFIIYVCQMKTMTINVSPERAQEATRTLQALLPLTRQRGRYIHISTSADGYRIDIPRATFNILVQVLQQMSEGHEIAIMPLHAELTTQQAAELLNVSRPYVIGLLDSGVIPSRKVGKHRRVLIKDILAYKQDSEQLRTQQLAELTAEAQRLGLGY